MQIIALVSLLFAIIIAVFAVQNTQTVSVNFLFFQTLGLPLSVVVLASAAIGAIFTFLLGLWRTIRSSLEIRNDRKRIAGQDRAYEELKQSYARSQENLRQLQKEIEQLKTRPAETISAPSEPPGTATTNPTGSSSRQPTP